MKKGMISLCLFFLSASICYAQMTTIIARMKNPVQCNKWGWVEGNVQTAWQGGCTPLEVESSDGHVYSVETTADLCGDHESAVYMYFDPREEISYLGCFPIKS